MRPIGGNFFFVKARAAEYIERIALLTETNSHNVYFSHTTSNTRTHQEAVYAVSFVGAHRVQSHCPAASCANHTIINRAFHNCFTIGRPSKRNMQKKSPHKAHWRTICRCRSSRVCSAITTDHHQIRRFRSSHLFLLFNVWHKSAFFYSVLFCCRPGRTIPIPFRWPFCEFWNK